MVYAPRDPSAARARSAKATAHAVSERLEALHDDDEGQGVAVGSSISTTAALPPSPVSSPSPGAALPCRARLSPPS